MPKWLVVVLSVFALIGFFNCAMLLFFAVGAPGSRSCIAYDVMSVPSPSKRFTVEVENFACTSPNDWETRVFLKDTQANQGVVAFDAPLTQESSGTFSTLQVQLKWLSDSQLQIFSPRGTNVKSKVDEWNGVVVSYAETARAAL